MPLAGKVILLTGGTGSFGRKFAEIVLKENDVEALRILSRDEVKQLEMNQQIKDDRLRFLIGDVRDSDRLYRAMNGVDIVVHTAALKQVPACEYNPFEAVLTNIIGAKNVIDASIDCGVERVIALSTDKAVNPVNLYGATKLCAEKLFVQGNAYAGGRGTSFACTRYGNVVGSRGSVIPLLKHQRRTGRITLTDPGMTRFWITLDQGVRFVIRCLEIMKGGEIFVPKIPSMRLTDLADALAADCRREIIGIRPGEKMHEVLISADEARHGVEYDDMYVINRDNPWANYSGLNGGKPLAGGFCYSSDNNVQWLSGEQFRLLVAEHS